MGIKTDVPGLQLFYHGHAHDVTVDLPEEAGASQPLLGSHICPDR